MSKHWHTLNGESGCMPDNNDVSRTKADAIASAQSTFQDCPCRGMVSDLRRYGIHYFKDHSACGAALVEVVECQDADCE